MPLDPKMLVSALHPEGSIFSICAFGDAGSVWFDFAESPDAGMALAMATDALARHHGVYHCVPNLTARPTKGRGTEKDAKDAWAAWADVDASSFEPISTAIKTLKERGAKPSDAKEQAWRSASDADRQAAKDSARVAIWKLPVGPPSTLVDSGRGWHPYWLLAKAETNLDLLRAVNKRIAKLVGGDKCWDLARVLKVPGTHNRKDPGAPVMAELCLFDGAVRHDLEALAAALGIPSGSADEAAPTASGSVPESSAQVPEPGDEGARPLPPDAERVARARAWVAKVPGAVSGDGGHDRTFAVAVAVVRGFAVASEDARSIMSEYNARCVPPWPEKDVDHKLADAATKGRLPRGYMYARDRAKNNGSGNGNGEHGAEADPASVDPEEARARARFSPEVVAAMESVEDVYDAEALADLALLREVDPAAFAVARAALAEKFAKSLRLRDLDRALASVPRRRAMGMNDAEERIGVDVKALFPRSPVPPGLVVPRGWILDARGVWRVLPDDGSECDRLAKCCDAPLAIVGRSVDVLDGTEAVDVAWDRGDGWRQKRVHRDQIADKRKVVDLAKHGFPANSTNASDVVGYLAAFEAANVRSISKAATSAAMGWIKDVGFLAGRTLVKSSADAPDVEFFGADAGDDQIAQAFSRRGTMDGWRAVAALAAKYPKVLVGIYAALAPPLLSALRAQNFVLDWASPTSTGKSTALRLAASAWGVPSERSGGLVRGWDSSRTYVERIAGIMNHLPIFLDDSARARSSEDVTRSIYDFSSGIGRGRGSVRGIARSTTNYGILLSTGEQKLTLLTSDSGTKARVLSLWGSPFDGTGQEEADAVAAISAGIEEHHGHAGPIWVGWIAGHRDEVEDWRCERRDWVGRYAEDSKLAVAGRMADYLGTLHVVMRLSHEALALPWPADDSMLGGLWGSVVEGAENADVAREALDHVASWCLARKSTFWQLGSNAEEPAMGWSGRWNESDGYVGIFPSLLRKILDDAKYPHFAITRSWLDRGWLASDDPKCATKRIRLADDIVRLVAIKKHELVPKNLGQNGTPEDVDF